MVLCLTLRVCLRRESEGHYENRTEMAPYSAATRWREGGGTGRPMAVASSIHAAAASCTDASAASAVSPSDMQPGRSGTSATKQPPSSSGSGSMITGYSSLGMACVLHQFDQPDPPADVDRLDRPAIGDHQNLTEAGPFTQPSAWEFSQSRAPVPSRPRQDQRRAAY